MTDKTDSGKAPDDWLHLKQYGYAPGNYMALCRTCQQIAHWVDKRTVTCRSCAEAKHASATTPTAPAAERSALTVEQMGQRLTSGAAGGERERLVAECKRLAERWCKGEVATGLFFAAIDQLAALPAERLTEEQEQAAFEAWAREQPGHPFAGVFTTLMRKAWLARAALGTKEDAS